MKEEKINWYTQVRMSNNTQIAYSGKYLPRDIDEAYEIQEQVIARIGNKVGGWKLGGTNSTTKKIFKCSQPYWGPIFSDKIFDARELIVLLEEFEIKGEIEVVFRLSEEIDLLDENTILTDVTRYVDKVAPGVELPNSCFSDILDGGIELLIADLCGSGALVTGDFIKIGEYSDSCALKASMSQHNKIIAEGNTNNILPSTIGALTDFLYLANKYGIHLEKGQYISTGGCTNCVNLEINDEVQVHIDGFEDFRFKITNMLENSSNV
jgi:2-keto-4-pentenoate hydratase